MVVNYPLSHQGKDRMILFKSKLFSERHEIVVMRTNISPSVLEKSAKPGYSRTFLIGVSNNVLHLEEDIK